MTPPAGEARRPERERPRAGGDGGRETLPARARSTESQSRRSLLAALAVAALAASALAGVLAVGDEVPDLALTMSTGREEKLSAHDGRAVLLVFYGPWAKRAPGDARTVAGLRKGREAQPLDLIGVARDSKAEDAAKFERDHTPGFPQAADPRAETYARFAEKGLPWVVVMDGKRKLRYSAGGVSDEAIDAVLTEILGQKAEEPKEEDAAK